MADPAKPSNRRLYYRQAMYVRIDLRVAGMRVALPCTLVDISGGGCQVHSRTMLKPRTSVEFDLPRPDQSSLLISGAIKKVTYTPENRTFAYTVEFATLDALTRDQLLRFVVDEQRRGLKRARSAPEVPPENARHKPMTRIQELRGSLRVEVNLPVQYSVDDAAQLYDATAIDVGTGGMRLIVDQVLRQEWHLCIRFTLPNDVLKALHQQRGGTAPALRPFGELRVNARALGGVKQSRGGFIQSLVFSGPDASAIEEIHRFVQATKLTTLRR
ncbi:MAG: PilZ domain-containing protein [Candidatus Eremiobacteraeota bacterium]|nr:PilZ domain-containing protein [Candidatus Eremiobacteraeota bacterium]